MFKERPGNSLQIKISFLDLPRGEIKNNSMRKLAAKTLMEILPPDLGICRVSRWRKSFLTEFDKSGHYLFFQGAEVQKKLDEQAATPDFVTLIGKNNHVAKTPWFWNL